MTTTELKQTILSKSFGGIMYDVTPGSALNVLVRDNETTARELVAEIEANRASNGIDAGVANFIKQIA